MSNIKQIGLGLLMLAQDADAKFDWQNDWQEQIRPYIKDEEVFICPETKENDAYSLNAALNNKAFVDIDDVASVVLGYEGKDQKFEFRHHFGEQKMTNILFVDGHVKSFSEKTLEVALKNGTVRWTP